MYVKFLSNKKGGGKGSVNYLLNEREKEGTAKVLKGNPKLTKSIISTIEKKQKVTFGVLSFEEKPDFLTNQEKLKIMADFEETLFPGMKKNQYNILWVEHSDKGRLELNFVIPKIELITQRALQPYYHKQDFSRVDMFEDICNIQYNLSSKKDPEKQQTLENDKRVNLIKDYKELDKTLHSLVATQKIQSRTELIQTLKSANIEVTRAGKDYISVKLPDSKRAKKFKKGIYDEQFRSIADIADIIAKAKTEAKAFRERDTVQELQTKTARLERYNKQKAEVFHSRYHSSRNTTTRNNGNISISNQKLESREQQPIQPTITISKPTVKKENTDDSTRTAAARYARNRESRKRARESRARAREERIALYTQHNSRTAETDTRSTTREYKQLQIRHQRERKNRRIIRGLFNKISEITNELFNRFKRIEAPQEAVKATISTNEVKQDIEKKEIEETAPKVENKEKIKPLKAPESLNATEESHSIEEIPQSEEEFQQDWSKFMDGVDKTLAEDNPKLK